MATQAGNQSSTAGNAPGTQGLAQSMPKLDLVILCCQGHGTHYRPPGGNDGLMETSQGGGPVADRGYVLQTGLAMEVPGDSLPNEFRSNEPPRCKFWVRKGSESSLGVRVDGRPIYQRCNHDTWRCSSRPGYKQNDGKKYCQLVKRTQTLQELLCSSPAPHLPQKLSLRPHPQLLPQPLLTYHIFRKPLDPPLASATLSGLQSTKL